MVNSLSVCDDNLRQEKRPPTISISKPLTSTKLKKKIEELTKSACDWSYTRRIKPKQPGSRVKFDNY
jgi:hypothetical protein